ncbi:DUF1376 domain-containing protein [Bartonella bovis]|uniref:Phage related protein n=1 Tax=Bartonella bovis 91-4 TaxID=1094491 RepID=N6VFC3_9HYPH|nr:DUF1376 domain-containing protein [Bartonella bovis]ENN91946.1 hypothetical protein BBbe_02460 [Bartonella bovis 91-4]
MATKLPWVKSFSSDCLADTSGMKAFQIATYVILQWHMRRSGEPIFCDQSKLAHSAGCSVKAFNKALDFLLRDQKIVRLEDGRLWSLQVEGELKNFIDKQEHISQVRSEAGKKGVQAKMLKKQFANDYVEANDKQNDFLLQANDKQNQAIKNQNQIYKKTNTIVLSKKENGSEDLATEVSVQSKTTDEMVEKHLDHDTPSSENQSPVSQQKSPEKKTKRSRGERGCRIPEDFEPDYDFAIQEGLPSERVRIEIENFKDHWRSSASPNAVKKDWPAAWRVWVRRKIEELEKGKNYGKPSIECTNQQRGWNYRVAQHMSNIKNSDSVYKFLFEDDERTAIPLEDGTKTIDCRSKESYLIG